MERLHGELLEAVWPALSEDQKSSICCTLKDVIGAIRKVHHPRFYGSVGRGPVPHHLFHSAEGDTAIYGPFNSESEFNAGLIERLKAI
jgi:hypothetical protein